MDLLPTKILAEAIQKQNGVTYEDTMIILFRSKVGKDAIESLKE